MPKLVIFDVDGTLIDSQAAILEAMGRAFAAAGRPAPAREAVLAIVGLSLPEAMAALLPAAGAGERAALVGHYRRAFADQHSAPGSTHPPFYPGARAGIARLGAAGYLLAIATGKARRGLDRMLAAHGLGRHFAATQTADDAPSKPHPGMVLNCLALTGAAPDATVVVGDTEYDMAMARAAGARRRGRLGLSRPGAADARRRADGGAGFRRDRRRDRDSCGGGVTRGGRLPAAAPPLPGPSPARGEGGARQRPAPRPRRRRAGGRR